MPANLDAALAYAQQGLPVFPLWPVRAGQCACGVTDCKNAGKHPIATLAPQGLKNATVDPTVITTWWTRWPDANIAGRLGNGVAVVLDVDPRHGGNESLAELIAENGSLPKGPVTLTGGGGKHYWFKHPGGVAPIAHGFRPGLDFQGDNTYVLLPPSSHRSGNEYRWETPLGTVPLPMVPAWLFSAADRPTRSTKRFEAGADGRIPHGQHNDFIVQTAASFASRIAGITEPVLMRQVTGALRESIDDVDAHAQEIDQAVRSAMGKYARPAPPVQPAPPPAGSRPSGSAPAASQFPSTLFIQTKTGLQESLPGFVNWFRSTDDFVVPTERGTFSSSGSFELLRYQEGYFNGMARAFIRGRVEDAFRAQTISIASRDAFREEVVRGVAATSEYFRGRSDFNPSGLLCLKNGVLDLTNLKGGVTPHPSRAPKDVFTWKLPVDYIPGAGCPTFDAFLERVQPDPKRRELIIDLMGYCLWRSNPFQIFVVNVGDGGNGKTTWLRVMEGLLGLDAIAAETLQALSSQRFAAAELEGKLANLCDDLPFDRPLQATGVLKMLTGEGQLSGERKFQAKFKFRFEGKLIANANRTPEVHDDTYAFWRRLIVVPWDVTIPAQERDPLLSEKLAAERPGILNRALEGLARVMLRAQNHEGFDPDGVFEKSKEEWHSRSDLIRAELLQDFREDPKGFVPNKDLYAWHVSRARNDDREPMAEKAFGIRVTRTFPLSRSEQRGHIWGRPGISRILPRPELVEQPVAVDPQLTLDGLPGPKTASNTGRTDFTSVDPSSLPGVTGVDLLNAVAREEGIPGLVGSTPGTPGENTPEPVAQIQPESMSGSSDKTTVSSGNSEAIDQAFDQLVDAIRKKGDIPFEWERLRGWLSQSGINEPALDGALGRAAGMGLIRKLEDGRWVLRQDSNANLTPNSDDEVAELPPNPRPFGRTHYTCSFCVTENPPGHDPKHGKGSSCAGCETCLATEEQRRKRREREAREVVEGRYATEEHDPTPDDSNTG